MKKHSQGFIDLAEEAKSRIKETNIEAVKKMVEDNDDVVIIDVREESEWEQGHLPNAIHLSKGVIERDIEKAVYDRNQKLVLYCGGGFRSALAADNLQKMGYTKVLSMDGGFTAWKESGFSIEEN